MFHFFHMLSFNLKNIICNPKSLKTIIVPLHSRFVIPIYTGKFWVTCIASIMVIKIQHTVLRVYKPSNLNLSRLDCSETGFVRLKQHFLN